MDRSLVLTLKNLRLLLGGSSGRKSADAERLDAFLADPGLVRSLQEDEHRRKRLPFLLVSLLAGLLLGAGAVLLALHPWRPAPAIRVNASSGEEMARVLAGQAQVFSKAKEIDRALSYSRLAAELAPQLVDTWDALAYALFYAGQTAEAEQAAQRCLKIDPHFSRCYHMLGDFSFYTGDWKQAERHWRKADAKRALSRLLLLEGRFDEAAPLVQKLARETPDDPYVQVMGDALRLGRLTPELQRKLAPDFVASRDPETAKGWQLLYARRYEEAATTFSRALRSSPRDGSAMIGRGWCLLKIGTTPREAQSAFEQARATWPTSYSALNGLAWSLKAQGQTEGAVTLWRQVIDLPRVDQMEVASSYKGLGAVYYERGDYPRANQYLALSVMRDPFDPETATLLRSTLGKLASP